MLVTVVTLVTIENVYYIIITSVEPHNGNCGDIHNFFCIFDDSIIFGNCGNLNPGELQCEEITLVFNVGTRLCTAEN